ncbi:hypothetical protein SCAB_58871 [Streptomyces scabiei 87.22]|uniref:Uncharacterized protein n=1 Tax=Streptomyces scabiei (strain 87.22) TaxID=680198 RepID=C9Z5S6_STRSW|nr:hypothetical protein SCAB_58871 [Streptomyces scabiei 87.22]
MAGRAVPRAPDRGAAVGPWLQVLGTRVTKDTLLSRMSHVRGALVTRVRRALPAVTEGRWAVTGL